MPASIAAASVNTLNVLPDWRRDCVARLKCRRRLPGACTAIARTAPVAGSIATTAPAGSVGSRSQ